MTITKEEKAWEYVDVKRGPMRDYAADYLRFLKGYADEPSHPWKLTDYQIREIQSDLQRILADAKEGNPGMAPDELITDEQLAKEREAIPFTPTKRLIRDDVLYVEEKDVPHPIYGYAKYHKEYSVTDLRGYRKGYEPRLEIRGIYAPNPEDTFRLQTGKLPPYQPTTTGDKLLAEMRRLGVHKAYRIGSPVPQVRRQGEWIYVKVGDTEMRGRPIPSGIDFEQVSPTYKQDELQKAVDTIEEMLKKGGNPMAKEPWQMTKEEFINYIKTMPRSYREALIGGEGRGLVLEAYRTGKSVHQLLVERAVSEGKPIPPEILAEYPDLRRGGNPSAVKDPMPSDENLNPRAFREGRHPYQPPEGIPTKVIPVRASTGEGYSLYDLSEGVWLGRRSDKYEEAVERADKENRRLWEAYKAFHPEAGNPHYEVCQTMELCHPIEASSKEEAIGLARDKGETDARTNLLKDWHIKRREGNPMNDDEIDQVATKVAARVLEETTLAVLDPAGKGLLLHFTEHEIEGAGLVVNEAKARATPCNCFTYNGREYCFSKGVIGMMSSAENPEQIAEFCKVGKSYEVKPGAKQRFESFAGAAEAAHKKIEGIPKGEKLVPWLGAMSEELEKRGIEV